MTSTIPVTNGMLWFYRKHFLKLLFCAFLSYFKQGKHISGRAITREQQNLVLPCAKDTRWRVEPALTGSLTCAFMAPPVSRLLQIWNALRIIAQVFPQ